MDPTIHLVVESGADKDKQISVPVAGARLGRSSKNDIVLVDPMLSRHHCRLFFRSGQGLWITDLGSSNETLVNGKAVQETRLRVGDTIEIGDTVLKVTNDGSPGPVDLGFAAPPEGRSVNRSRIIFLLAAVVVVSGLAVAAWLPRSRKPAPPVLPEPPVVRAPVDETVEIRYEKVQADAENIFRYNLAISDKNMISVRIDDIANDRHVTKEQPIEPELARRLARDIVAAGFFTLDEEYQGIQPEVLDLWDISVTMGRKTRRVRVLNRVAPDVFAAVRDKIEQAGKMELGLWAIQFSPEKLTQMAREAFLLGKKLYDEREVKFGNLAGAIRSFKEADWYLETVEPKPEFYADIISNSKECERELQEKHDDRNFRAERAIRLREWDKAAAELRIICEMIPDRSDTRNVEAREKLLAVEGRLEPER